MERMIVKEILNPKDRDKRAKQYQEWLQEHGYATTLIDAHSDTQTINQMLAHISEIQAATEKLTALAHTLNTKR